MFFLYILQSETSGSFYVGSTRDLDARLARHNSGKVASTRSKRPWKLVYSEQFTSRSQARYREIQIKSWKNPSYMIKTLGIPL
jgi:putative endonuclease